MSRNFTYEELEPLFRRFHNSEIYWSARHPQLDRNSQWDVERRALDDLGREFGEDECRAVARTLAQYYPDRLGGRNSTRYAEWRERFYEENCLFDFNTVLRGLKDEGLLDVVGRMDSQAPYVEHEGDGIYNVFCHGGLVRWNSRYSGGLSGDDRTSGKDAYPYLWAHTYLSSVLGTYRTMKQVHADALDELDGLREDYFCRPQDFKDEEERNRARTVCGFEPGGMARELYALERTAKVMREDYGVTADRSAPLFLRFSEENARFFPSFFEGASHGRMDIVSACQFFEQSCQDYSLMDDGQMEYDSLSKTIMERVTPEPADELKSCAGIVQMDYAFARLVERVGGDFSAEVLDVVIDKYYVHGEDPYAYRTLGSLTQGYSEEACNVLFDSYREDYLTRIRIHTDMDDTMATEYAVSRLGDLSSSLSPEKVMKYCIGTPSMPLPGGSRSVKSCRDDFNAVLDESLKGDFCPSYRKRQAAEEMALLSVFEKYPLEVCRDAVPDRLMFYKNALNFGTAADVRDVLLDLKASGDSLGFLIARRKFEEGMKDSAGFEAGDGLFFSGCSYMLPSGVPVSRRAEHEARALLSLYVYSRNCHEVTLGDCNEVASRCSEHFKDVFDVRRHSEKEIYSMLYDFNCGSGAFGFDGPGMERKGSAIGIDMRRDDLEAAKGRMIAAVCRDSVPASRKEEVLSGMRRVEEKPAARRKPGLHL